MDEGDEIEETEFLSLQSVLDLLSCRNCGDSGRRRAVATANVWALCSWSWLNQGHLHEDVCLTRSGWSLDMLKLPAKMFVRKRQ
jgi:hypothetical protein